VPVTLVTPRSYESADQQTSKKRVRERCHQCHHDGECGIGGDASPSEDQANPVAHYYVDGHFTRASPIEGMCERSRLFWRDKSSVLIVEGQKYRKG